ncbi:unnamed protein product, partial [Didymodactylos carnosus]
NGSSRKAYNSAIQPLQYRSRQHRLQLRQPPPIHLLLGNFRWDTNGTTIASNGTPGSTANQLNSPYTLVIDKYDHMYIADTQNHRIQKVVLSSLVITTVVGNGTGLNTPTNLLLPTAVYVDKNQIIYTADLSSYRIRLWTNSFTSTNIAGANSTFIQRVCGLWVDSIGTIYAADAVFNYVIKFPVGALTGTIVAGSGIAGNNTNQLNLPWGLYVDETNSLLYVSNSGGNTVAKWSIGSSTGTFLVGPSGLNSTLLNHPLGITRDDYGNLYVADCYNNRIQMYCASNISEGITIIGDGVGTDSTHLDCPTSVAFDSNSTLYVSDLANHRVQKYTKL